MAVAQQTFEQLTTRRARQVDPEIADLLGARDRPPAQPDRADRVGELHVAAVLEAIGSTPTNKYAEGYPGKRYYGGCEVVDEIEQLAIDRAKELFGADHANVQPHAGAQTNMAVYMAALQPGDTILSLRARHGGHLTHGLKVNSPAGSTRSSTTASRARRTSSTTTRSSRARRSTAAADRLRRLRIPAHRRDRRFREIADEVGALLLATWPTSPASSPPGLHPNPVEHCDFVTSTTHKTLAGPRSGFVLCREEHAQAVDRAVFPGMQGGPLVHTIAAKAACFRIAATEAFRDYQRQVRANADTLAETLIDGGLDVLTGGTDTHLLQLDLRATEWTGKDAEERLARGEADREPQHGAVRRAAADGRLRRPDRHAGGDDARLRRGGLPRGRRGSSSARSARTPISTRSRPRRGALREAPALPGLPRLDDVRPQ